MNRISKLVPLAFLMLTLLPAAARAEFGLTPGTAAVTALNRDGTIDLRAGSHPYSYNVHFQFNTDGTGKVEGGEPRNVIIDLPPGLIGNPEAVPGCPREKFEGGAPNCPSTTQIGVLRAILPGFPEAFGPIYNLEPPPGTAAQLGFSNVTGLEALQSASLRPGDYGVHVNTPDIPIEVASVTATIWGTPADPEHTPERGPEGSGFEIPSEAPLLPFLTLPTSCQGSPSVTIQADSKLAPGVFSSVTVPTLDKGGNEVSLAGCDLIPFSPKALAATSLNSADSASGLQFDLQLPNQGLLDSEARSETVPVKTEVALPAGIIANPAAAGGLGVCSEAQFNSAQADSGPGQGCPQSSKLGTLVANSPLLDEPVEGAVYLATPHANPFGSLIALYIVAAAPQRGVVIKQAGVVTPNPVTGQLTTTFDHLPPIPYSSFTLRLREGARAPLITPQTCGTYTATAKLYPFSDPGTETVRTAPFNITSGAGGSPCAASEAQLPIKPALAAGANYPIAGAYSPFSFRLTRQDGEQRFGAVSSTLPLGLVGRLAGIPYCSESAIATAISRSYEGGGAVELASPSCPAASRVGSVTATAGAGPAPYAVSGTAYLAGPYQGAPLSLVIVTPALAGPFDLGVVVVRAGIHVDESSAQITVRSDALPRIVHGIVLDIRGVSIDVDRDQFALNPTSCREKSVGASVTSLAGITASLQNRFQVGACGALGFKPSVSLSLKGGTRRTQHPKLRAVVTYPKGDYANIARASVILPSTEFIDPARVANPCTRPQFAEGRCPAGSVLGTATAYTPLLDKPLTGKVYFRANGGARELPDMVVDLKGQVHLTLVGFVDAVVKKGTDISRIRNTFAQVPDAPVSKFVLELKGGKQGLLVNSRNLCKEKPRATVKLRSQNELDHNFMAAIATSCNQKKRGK